jgi:hypothetical protein
MIPNLNPFRKIVMAAVVRVPASVRGSFDATFKGAKNIEWSRHGGLFEVIFYHEEKEMIARFDREGTLLEYRINLQLSTIDNSVRGKASPEGEIMNCIEVHSHDAVRYEFIVRDKELTRYLLLTDMEGNRIRKEKL